MIKKIHIEKFKSLKNTGELQIRPLTLLVGPNSSGKSSLIQLILMLKQTTEVTDLETYLSPNGNFVQLGTYNDFIFNHDLKNSLEVSLEFLQFRKPMPNIKSSDQLTLSSKFSYNSKTTQIFLRDQIVNRIDLNDDVNITQKVSLKKRNKYSADLSFKRKNKINKWTVEDVTPLKFYDFLIRRVDLAVMEKKPRIALHMEMQQYFFNLPRIIAGEFRKISYVGPLREYPQRIYIPSGQSPQNVGSKGEFAVDALWYSEHTAVNRKKEVKTKAQKWFREFGFATEFKLQSLVSGNFYLFNVKDPNLCIDVNLKDVGFGASQTLPIIIECFYSANSSTVLIEQPEIHLHPKAQAVMGDLFIEAITESDRTFIIETHSEHLLSRVRRRIAEKKLSKDDVAIYYFDPGKEGTTVKEITLNEKGQFESFPAGFFEEGLNEAFEHLKAMS